MTQDSIQREITIEARPERVWALLTEAEHLGRWFGDAGAEIDLRPGGAFILRWEAGMISRGFVETVEPHSRFAWRWAQQDVPVDAPLDPGNSTLVEFTLEPAGDGTLLSVLETGFDALDGGPDHRLAALTGNTDGWRQKTAAIADYAVRAAV